MNSSNLKKIVHYLEKQYKPLVILLTGSRAYGKPKVESDWDMVVITESTTDRIKSEWEGLSLDIHILH